MEVGGEIMKLVWFLKSSSRYDYLVIVQKIISWLKIASDSEIQGQLEKDGMMSKKASDVIKSVKALSKAKTAKEFINLYVKGGSSRTYQKEAEWLAKYYFEK